MHQVKNISSKFGDLTRQELQRVFALIVAILATFVCVAFWPPGWMQSVERWIDSRAMWSGLPFWAYIIIMLVDTHITTACVTLFLHRCLTHRSIVFNRLVGYGMEFWLWVRTSMPSREWVAVHRCHHANVETNKDPHSPVVYGIWRVIIFGVPLYHKPAKDQLIVAQYAKGVPNRWVYSRLSALGPVLTLVSNLLLFGHWGLPMWLFEMAWIPFFAAGVINGLGHWWGNRNYDTPDNSKNLPGNVWSIITCGESLHNNHHHIQNSPKFSMEPGEIDPGWLYYICFRTLGLARLGVGSYNT